MLTAAFFALLFALLAASTPLGDRSLASRQGAGNGVQVSRRFILASRVDAPPACVALAANASTTVPTDNSTLPLDPTSSSNSTSPSSSSDPPEDPTSPSDAGSNTNTTIPLEIRPLSDSSRPPPAPSSSSGSSNGAHVSNSLTRRRHSFGLGKRIAQADLPDIAQQWQDLCLSSGGPIFSGNFSTNTTTSSSSANSNSNSTDPSDSSPCVALAGFGGLDALLADADPCAQQDIADLMILFAKSSPVSNQAALIDFAIKYRQHPRNALNVLGIVPSTPYCQRAPKSQELVGIFNAQLEGVDPGVFGGPKFTLVPFGANGTCPFGQVPDVESCTCLNSTSTATGVDGNATATATVTVTGDAEATPTVSATIAGDDTSVSGTALPPPGPTSPSSSSDDTSSDDTSDSPSPDDTSDDSVDPTTDSSTSDDTSSSSSDDTSNPSPPATSPSPSPATSPSTDSNDSSEGGGNQPSQNTPKTPGPVFQPDDIDGDVNDPEGRRRRRRAEAGGRRGGRYARGLRRV